MDFGTFSETDSLKAKKDQPVLERSNAAVLERFARSLLEWDRVSEELPKRSQSTV